MKKTPVEERIKRNVTIKDSCWEWNKALFKDGYGQIQEGGKSQRAHRVSYLTFVGEIKEGMCVCHSCDNPKCVNPEHLFLGTYKDNALDKVVKNRQAKGALNGNSKLTPRKAFIIKTLLNMKQLHKEIATKFKISVPTVSRISRNIAWGINNGT
jgi:hypothetical protein